MTIEALVRWTDFQLKHPDVDDELNRIINGGDNKPQIEVSYSYSPMCFEVEDVLRFNKPTDPDYTVLRFKDGDNYVVQIPYLKFRDLWTETTGKSVMSLIPEKKRKKKDLDDSDI